MAADRVAWRSTCKTSLDAWEATMTQVAEESSAPQSLVSAVIYVSTLKTNQEQCISQERL